jgi:hypothetical protein
MYSGCRIPAAKKRNSFHGVPSCPFPPAFLDASIYSRGACSACSTCKYSTHSSCVHSHASKLGSPKRPGGGQVAGKSSTPRSNR